MTTRTPIGIAARDIKKGQIVFYDWDGNTDDIITKNYLPPVTRKVTKAMLKKHKPKRKRKIT